MYKKFGLVSLVFSSCFGVKAEHFEMPTESDSDTDFKDSEVFNFSTGLIYRF